MSLMAAEENSEREDWHSQRRRQLWLAGERWPTVSAFSASAARGRGDDANWLRQRERRSANRNVNSRYTARRLCSSKCRKCGVSRAAAVDRWNRSSYSSGYSIRSIGVQHCWCKSTEKQERASSDAAKIRTGE